MAEQKIREADYQQGLIGEHNISDKLRNMGYHIETRPRYDPFDLTMNEKNLVEIKKRNIYKDTYNTTILPWSKILEYNEVKKDYRDLICIFSFKDGNFYTSYNKLARMKDKLDLKKFTRYSGFQHASRLHLFIPTSLLRPLDELTLAT